MTPARLATIRRQLAERDTDRAGYVWGLMMQGEYADPAVRAVIWERPDAAEIIAGARAEMEAGEDR